MNLKNVRVAHKLWATILGLLVVMLLCNLWVRSNTEQALIQASDDIQYIERKIAYAQHMRGAAMTGLEMGIAQFATNELRLQQELEKRFQNRRQISSAALKSMEELLKTEEDKAQFALVLQARKMVESTRAQAEANLDPNDYNARANFAFGDYGVIGAKYSQAFDDFMSYQTQQLDVVQQRAAEYRRNSAMTGWGITIVLLLLGVMLTRWLVQTITRPLEDAVSLTQAIGDGQLNVNIQTDRKDEFGQLLNALSLMTGKLRTVIGEVRAGVDAVSSAAGQIATGNQDLSARTEQTAANLQQTAASVEQMNASVEQAADTSRQANQLAGTAVQAAERGGEVVQQVVHSMEQINSSSRKISDIIGVIDGIAFQTNILALNAAVEAARAGEQGRGFAVVAGEVRTLAQRSAEAAKEIKGLIEASVHSVDTGSAQVQQAGASMEEIVASVRRVTDLIGEITASTHEQSEGFSQVNTAVSNLDQMTQQNAALVEESSAAAAAMSEQAQRLMQVVAVFNLGHEASHAVRAPAKTPAFTARQATSVPAAAKPTTASRTSAASKPSAPKALATPRPAPRPSNTSDDDWETF